MEFDNAAIEKLLQLDDATLKGVIQQIATISGVDSRQAAKTTVDMEKLRKKMATITEADLKKAVNFVGEDTAKQILQQLKQL